MSEYILEPAHWPDMPPAHGAFLEAAIPKVRGDERLVGLAAGGSFISRSLDEHSDLDLVVVARPASAAEVLRDGVGIAGGLGPLLATFRGDHVGELRLLISDRRGARRHRGEERPLSAGAPAVDRGSLLGVGALHRRQDSRGELFEAIDALGFVRARVLGPLILTEAAAQPSGVRRVEQSAPERVAALRSTLASHDRRSRSAALVASVALSSELRQRLAPPTLRRRTAAEQAVRDWLVTAGVEP